ncbi:hypothetical protein BDF19DRAFT_424320 [Syncephalis fuscata]|nr:hypothetical protein BDF19DRAFT_424320 [Syncephalis fuscata]
MQRTFLVLRRCVLECANNRRSSRAAAAVDWELDLASHRVPSCTKRSLARSRCLTNVKVVIGIRSLHTSTLLVNRAGIPSIATTQVDTAICAVQDITSPDSAKESNATMKMLLQHQMQQQQMHGQEKGDISRQLHHTKPKPTIKTKSCHYAHTGVAPARLKKGTFQKAQTKCLHIPIAVDNAYTELACELTAALHGAYPVSADHVWQIYAKGHQSVDFLYAIDISSFRRLLRVLEWRYGVKHTAALPANASFKEKQSTDIDIANNEVLAIDPRDSRAQQAERILQVIKDMRRRGLKPPDNAYRALMRDAIWLTNAGNTTWTVPRHDIILRKELLRAHLTIFRLKRDTLRVILDDAAEAIAAIDQPSTSKMKRGYERYEFDMPAITKGRITYQQIIESAANSLQRPLALLAYNDIRYNGHSISVATERLLWQTLASRRSPYRDISTFVAMRQLLINRDKNNTENDATTTSNAMLYSYRDATAQLVSSNNLMDATKLAISFYNDGIQVPIHLLNQLLALLCEAYLLKTAVVLLRCVCLSKLTDSSTPENDLQQTAQHSNSVWLAPTRPDTVSFNTVANAFVDQGDWEAAHDIVCLATDMGIKPTGVTINVQLKAELAREIKETQAAIDSTSNSGWPANAYWAQHQPQPAQQRHPSVATSSSLTIVERALNNLIRQNDLVESQLNVSTYNLCLTTLMANDYPEHDSYTGGLAAYRLVNRMEAANIAPNLVTCHTLLRIYGRKKDRKSFVRVLKMMAKHQLMPNRTTQAIILQYSDPHTWRWRPSPI